MRIDELSHEAIVKLTDGDLATMVKIRCAEEGIKLAIPPEKPENFEVTRDIKIFSVAGIHTRNEKFAQEASDFFEKNKQHLVEIDYEWQISSTYKYVRPIPSHKFESISTISSEYVLDYPAYENVKIKLANHKKMQEAYEKEKREYDENYKALSAIEQEIYNIYSDAMAKQRELEKYQRIFAEYEQISDSREQARKFFLKAYSVGHFFYERLFPEDMCVVDANHILPVDAQQ